MIKIFLSALILAFSSIAIGQINFQDLTIDEAIVKAKAENKKVFIDVFTTWCGPCKLLDKNVFKTAEIGDRMNPDYISIKVDAERYTDQERFSEFNVRAYPTMIILNGEGKEIKRIIGNMVIEEFHDHLDEFIDPALLPRNIALQQMKENPNNEEVWRRSLTILFKKNQWEFHDSCQVFVDKFGLNKLNNALDSSIFYGAVLPLETPIVQRILSDSSYMPYSKEIYHRIDLVERARTAPTEAEYLALVEQAKAAEEAKYMAYRGDYVIDHDYLESLKVENLNPVYMRENPKSIEPLSRKDRRKLKKALRRQKRKGKK